MPTLTVPLVDAAEDTAYAGVYQTVLLIPHAAVAELLRRERNPTRVVVETGSGHRLHTGLMNDGRGDHFITVNQQLRKREGWDVGDQITLTITPDDSDYGIPVPGEVTELWALDPAARAAFHSLSPGHQRNLLYQIDKLKRPDSRARRAVQIHEYLVSVNGDLDYKALNAWIKADNAR